MIKDKNSDEPLVGEVAEPKETAKKEKKQVVCISMNEHHRTAILEPKGYSVGEKAKYAFMVNSDFEFTVNGDNQQIVKF